MQYIYASPIGEFLITYTEKYITGLHFDKPKEEHGLVNSILEQAVSQLDAYFKGNLRLFKLPIDMIGTDFQKKVWLSLVNIPYGCTASYGEIAKDINHSKASRAVGGANNKNPISIIVPCHRVIGHNGAMTGYGGGLWRKEWLLSHEAKYRI